MRLSPRVSLSFHGQCQTGFVGYAQCMGGEVVFMLTWGDSPAAAEAPPGWQTKLYHATLRIGATVIYGGDPVPDKYDRPRGFSVMLEMDDAAAADRIFQALVEQARVDMPLQETF